MPEQGTGWGSWRRQFHKQRSDWSTFSWSTNNSLFFFFLPLQKVNSARVSCLGSWERPSHGAWRGPWSLSSLSPCYAGEDSEDPWSKGLAYGHPTRPVFKEPSQIRWAFEQRPILGSRPGRCMRKIVLEAEEAASAKALRLQCICILGTARRLGSWSGVTEGKSCRRQAQSSCRGFQAFVLYIPLTFRVYGKWGQFWPAGDMIIWLKCFVCVFLLTVVR